MTALFGLCSFAVDYGRVRLAKSSLQAAADSAALAGAKLVSSGVSAVQTEVVKYGNANTCDGSAIVIDPNNDIDFLTYDPVSRSSTVLTGAARTSANAIRVRCERTKTKNNPIDLVFGGLIGLTKCDVHAQATAYQSPNHGGYIGLSLTRMYNTATFDGYNANVGAYPSSRQAGTLLSYADLWLYDTSSVYGEAHWDTTGTFNHDATAIISPGPCNSQTLNNNFPAPSLGNVATVNNNNQLTQYYTNNQLVIADNKPPVTYPAGTYYFTKFDIGTGNHVYFNGPTTIYLNCAGDITSTLAASDFKPANLSVLVTAGHNWKFDAGGVFYGSFYNPSGDLHHHNGGISYGSVISDLLCFRQTSQGHQDLSLGKYAVTVGVVLVK
jgi:Flp pilus assembly protein TadG